MEVQLGRLQWLLAALLTFACLSKVTTAISFVEPLNLTYYQKSCPQVHRVVKDRLTIAVTSNRKVAASLARLLFHDCFVEVRLSNSVSYKNS